MTAERYVLDTNVLVCALLFPTGRLSWLRHAWQSEAFVPLVSQTTVSEFIRVLHYPKFKLDKTSRQDLIDDYLPWCETIVVRSPTKVPACRDPADQAFLELAVAANADGLVSGDQDLLTMEKDISIPIISPESFQTMVMPSR